MPSVTFRLSAEQLAYIEERAAKRGLTRSAWLKTLIDMHRAKKLVERKDPA